MTRDHYIVCAQFANECTNILFFTDTTARQSRKVDGDGDGAMAAVTHLNHLLKGLNLIYSQDDCHQENDLKLCLNWREPLDMFYMFVSACVRQRHQSLAEKLNT